MSIFPAPGLFDRLRSRWLLRKHPNYKKFKRHLISIWGAK